MGVNSFDYDFLGASKPCLAGEIKLANFEGKPICRKNCPWGKCCTLNFRDENLYGPLSRPSEFTKNPRRQTYSQPPRIKGSKG